MAVSSVEQCQPLRAWSGDLGDLNQGWATILPEGPHWVLDVDERPGQLVQESAAAAAHLWSKQPGNGEQHPGADGTSRGTGLLTINGYASSCHRSPKTFKRSFVNTLCGQELGPRGNQLLPAFLLPIYLAFLLTHPPSTLTSHLLGHTSTPSPHPGSTNTFCRRVQVNEKASLFA